MIPDILAKHFDLLADATNGISKLRELIFQLAVQGKLVPQDPRDEPAEVLKGRVAAILPIKQSENPFLSNIVNSVTTESEYELPLGWAWLALGHIGIWATGCGFPTQYQGKSEGEFLFCKVSDMNLPGNEVEICSTVNSINSDVLKKIRARANPVGTVIFPKIGGAIATNKRRLVIKPTIIDNNCSGIQPIGLTDKRWLLILMQSIDLTKYQSGTSVPSVSQNALNPIRIGLPPLAEQHRIVAKVDELMALCDELEERQRERKETRVQLCTASHAALAAAPDPRQFARHWQRICDHFHLLYDTPQTIPVLRQTVLTLAVQGKLVLQNPNDEPVNVLLERLVFLTAEGGKVPKPLRPLDADVLPFVLPLTWKWVQAQDLCKPSSLITYGVLKPVWVDVGVPTVRVQDMQNGMIAVAGVGQCSLERASKFCKTTLEAGDLLIAKDGATLGKTAFVPTSLAGGNITQHVLRFPMTPHVNSLFIRLVIDSPHGQAWMRSETKGVALPGVNVGDFRRMPIPLPPLAEQCRIVAKVDQLMTLCNELEKQLTQSEAEGEKLLEAFVHHLLNGKTPASSAAA